MKTAMLQFVASATRLLTLAAALSALAASAQASVTWDVQYEGNVNPGAASPAWAEHLSGTQANRSSDGTVLSIDTNGPSSAYFVVPSWTYSVDSTIEFRTSVGTLNSTGGSPTVIGGGIDGFAGKFWNISLREDGFAFVGAGGTNVYPLDAHDFHVYRITIESSGLTLYVDGNTTPALLSPTGYNLVDVGFEFGDGNGNDGGTSQWDYVYYTNQGAFAPEIPEPASLGLLSLGGLVLLRRK